MWICEKLIFGTESDPATTPVLFQMLLRILSACLYELVHPIQSCNATKQSICNANAMQCNATKQSICNANVMQCNATKQSHTTHSHSPEVLRIRWSEEPPDGSKVCWQDYHRGSKHQPVGWAEVSGSSLSYPEVGGLYCWPLVDWNREGYISAEGCQLVEVRNRKVVQLWWKPHSSCPSTCTGVCRHLVRMDRSLCSLHPGPLFWNAHSIVSRNVFWNKMKMTVWDYVGNYIYSIITMQLHIPWQRHPGGVMQRWIAFIHVELLHDLLHTGDLNFQMVGFMQIEGLTTGPLSYPDLKFRIQVRSVLDNPGTFITGQEETETIFSSSLSVPAVVSLSVDSVSDDGPCECLVELTKLHMLNACSCKKHFNWQLK